LGAVWRGYSVIGGGRTRAARHASAASASCTCEKEQQEVQEERGDRERGSNVL
jgi:hypothetical protein